MTLILATLAVFFLWETLLSLCPWRILPVLQPNLVFLASVALVYPDWRTALAVSGAVTILHILVVQRDSLPTSSASPRLIARPDRRSNVPGLP